MTLSGDAIIEKEKLTHYLLKRQPYNDKSKFLKTAGYELKNWKQLEDDLRKQILPLIAQITEENEYGVFYNITELLKGPNDSVLDITTIWLFEHKTQQTRFITLFPNKNKR